MINSINGHIRHSARLVQLHRVCLVLHIAPLTPAPSLTHTLEERWRDLEYGYIKCMIYGILDADGTVTLNTTNKLKFHTGVKSTTNNQRH